MSSKESKHYVHEGIEFWAEDGFVRVVDTVASQDSSRPVDERIKSLEPAEWFKRILGTYVSMSQSRFADVRFRARQLLERGKEVAYAAKRQGCPLDEVVLEHHIRHQKKTSILVPGVNDKQQAPALAGVNYKIQMDEPRNMLLNGVEVVPDHTLSLGQVMAANQRRR